MSCVFSELLGHRPAALLFDLDGTLVDSAPDLAAALDATLQSLGFVAAGESLTRSWVGNGARVLVQRALAHSFGCQPEAVAEASLDVAHRQFLDHYGLMNGRHSRLYPGVREALESWYLQQLPMAVVTNKPIQFVPVLLASLRIEQFFSVSLGGECVPDKKPHPGMLLTACEQLGVVPAACVMIGDSRTDILAARAANMPVIAVDYGYNHGRSVACEQPDRLVSSLRDISSS